MRRLALNIIPITYSLVLVSMETLASDVQNLRKGLDAAKMEKEKQADNYALHVSISIHHCRIVIL